MNPTETFQVLVADEPPYLLDPDAVVRRGRRRRHARTAVLSATTAGALGLAAVAAATLSTGRDSTPDRLLPAAPAQAAPAGELEQLVRAHTPGAWTLSTVHETVPDGFQADVDDGAGASRLYLGISPSPGSLQQHPCSDHEFALDGPCTERSLDADTRLITRGPAASGPVTSTVVVIVHRDGSGVDVGNDNATWPWADPPAGTVVTAEEKRLMSTPSVNRPLPVYSVAQLVEIARAVDAAR